VTPVLQNLSSGGAGASAGQGGGGIGVKAEADAIEEVAYSTHHYIAVLRSGLLRPQRLRISERLQVFLYFCEENKRPLYVVNKN
jgi:hypothetical protein